VRHACMFKPQPGKIARIRSELGVSRSMLRSIDMRSCIDKARLNAVLYTRTENLCNTIYIMCDGSFLLTGASDRQLLYNTFSEWWADEFIDGWMDE